MAKVITNALLEALRSKDPKLYDVLRSIDTRLNTIEGTDADSFLQLISANIKVKTYIPILTASVTNPTLGNSVLTGWQIKIGPICFYGLIYSYGNAGVAAGNGTYYFSLPYRALTLNWFAPAEVYIAGTKTYPASAAPADATKVQILCTDVGQTLTHNTPAAWTNTSYVKINGWYIVDDRELP